MTSERTIQQTAAETGLSEYTLRYYEKIGLILNIKRAPSGHRRYIDSDLEWIKFLQQLKATGMPLSDMKTFAELRKQGLITSKARREMLQHHRQEILDQIDELERCLVTVDLKIERHRRNEALLNHE